ncbi:MAG: hypothetical protein P8X59_06870 [Woeseiaceae bacterium]|jgi:hypothetical protein
MQTCRFLFSIFLACLTLSACQAPAPLNSERIADRYGSYGVEILSASDLRRVTSLYSGAGVDKTMRTLAVVDFESATDSRIATEHAAIIAGGSIGAVFKEHGWLIHKDTVELCEQKFDSDRFPSLALMQIPLPQLLAVHRYRFSVSRNRISIDYALITEVYHPDYLGRKQLDASNVDHGPGAGKKICATPVSELPATSDPAQTLTVSPGDRS